MHCLSALGQWVVQLLQHTASLPRCNGRWNSCNTRPHWLGAVAIEILQPTAPLPGGSGHCSYCNAVPDCMGGVQLYTLQCYTLPQCLGAVGSAKSHVARPGHTSLGGRGVLPRRWSVRSEEPAKGLQSSRPGHTSLGGHGVLPWRWSVRPKEPAKGLQFSRPGHTKWGGTGFGLVWYSWA